MPLFFTTLLACGMMDQQTQEGTRLFLFAPGEPVKISVDGGPETELSAFVALGVGPGEHTVAVNGGEPIQVSLEPFDELVVPVVPGQCFMSLDVSLSDYGAGSKEAPAFSSRLRASEAFKLPANTYGDKSELPSSISSGQRVFLLRSAPCYVVDDLQYGLTGQVTLPDGTPDPMAASVAQLRRAVCSPNEKPTRWCTSLREWVQIGGSPMPQQPTAFIGLSRSVPAGADEETLKQTATTPSVLALDPSGRSPNASLTGLNAESPEEQAELDAAAQAAATWLSGSGVDIPVGPGLGGWLDGWGAQASTALEPRGAGWDADGVELRKVGQGWVSVSPLAEGKGYSVAIHGPYEVGE